MAPEDPYPFDRLSIRNFINGIISANAGRIPGDDVDIVEAYTGNRFCSAVKLAPLKTVILDFGFMELLADNIAIEYIGDSSAHAMTVWSMAGRPDHTDPTEEFALRGFGSLITGGMAVRDLTCKLLPGLVTDPNVYEQIVGKLLWKMGDERPNRPYHCFLAAPENRHNVRAVFLADEHAEGTFSDQMSMATAFVACHEVSHLLFDEREHSEWTNSPLARDVQEMLAVLFRLSVTFDDQQTTLGSIASIAQSDHAMVSLIYKEALVDIRATEMLIESERQCNPGLEKWAPFAANLFGLVSMINSLGIFRGYLARSIRNKGLDSWSLQTARSEAVLRNLVVLAYLFVRHEHLAGASRARNLMSAIKDDWLHLQRRMLYFYLDLTANISELEWGHFLSSAHA